MVPIMKVHLIWVPIMAMGFALILNHPIKVIGITGLITARGPIQQYMVLSKVNSILIRDVDRESSHLAKAIHTMGRGAKDIEKVRASTRPQTVFTRGHGNTICNLDRGSYFQKYMGNTRVTSGVEKDINREHKLGQTGLPTKVDGREGNSQGMEHKLGQMAPRIVDFGFGINIMVVGS
jgi:hypothetical protein